MAATEAAVRIPENSCGSGGGGGGDGGGGRIEGRGGAGGSTVGEAVQANGQVRRLLLLPFFEPVWYGEKD